MLIVLNKIQLILINLSILFMILTLFLIITRKNPVFAVFSFILTAIAAFSFLILIGAEFFSLLILVIYTGVITVLFLFVVIIYNLRSIKEIELHNILANPLMLVVAYKVYWANAICMNCLDVLLTDEVHLNSDNLFTLDVFHFIALFNDHYLVFLFAGLLIFIAILGSIVITYPFYKHQK